MNEAREVMDRITRAVLAGDADELARCYAEDAVVESPDVGRLVGRDAVVDYLMSFTRSFSETAWEPLSTLESGDIAVDEGCFIGTNTGPLAMPDGEVPATGKSLRLRETDVLTVAGGRAVSHRFYFDQMDLLSQLGLLAESGAAVPAPRDTSEEASPGVRA